MTHLIVDTTPRQSRLFTVAIGLLLAGCSGSSSTTAPNTTPVAGPFTISEPAVTLDPYGTAPLAAEIAVTASEPITARVAISGGSVPIDYTISEAAADLVVPVIALNPGSDNTVSLTFEDQEGYQLTHEVTITAPPLPDYFPDILIDEHNELAAEGLVFADFAWGQGDTFFSKPLAFDSSGAIRWWLDLESLGTLAIPLRRTDRNTLIVGADNAVYEYSLTGERLRTVRIPGYTQHHEVLEKPNGNLVVAVKKNREETDDDHIIEVTWAGNVVNEWDLRTLLDVHRGSLVEASPDWFHMNAIFHDARDDSLIVSGRNQGVVKLSSDKRLIWILAPHEGWGNAGLDANGPDTSAYLLTAVDANGTAYPDAVQLGQANTDDFDFPWGQHAAMVQENGHVLLYDNGFNRLFGLPHDDYSRVVEYRIDEAAMTVEQIWQYGRERGIEHFSPIVSDVDILPNGNRLMTSGISFAADPPQARISEISYPEKIIAFEAILQFRNTASDNTFAWGDLDLVYRAEKWMPFSD